MPVNGNCCGCSIDCDLLPTSYAIRLRGTVPTALCEEEVGGGYIPIVIDDTATLPMSECQSDEVDSDNYLRDTPPFGFQVEYLTVQCNEGFYPGLTGRYLWHLYFLPFGGNGDCIAYDIFGTSDDPSVLPTVMYGTTIPGGAINYSEIWTLA